MSEIEIGRAKRGRRAYAFDDIAIVPAGAPATRRTSASPGRSTRTPSTSRCSPRRWTPWCRRAPRSRSASSAASACSTSRASGRATTTREGARGDPRPQGRRRDDADAADLRRADQARAGHRAARRDPRRRRAGRRRAQPAAHPGALQDRGGRRRRPVRDPRHDGERRARRAAVEPLNLKKFIYELDVPVIVGGARPTRRRCT